MQTAAVYGKHGNAVFIHVDAVILGEDVHIAPMDGQMQFGIETLVTGSDVQHTCTGGFAVNIERLVGIERAVCLQPLLLRRVGVLGIFVFVLGL